MSVAPISTSPYINSNIQTSPHNFLRFRENLEKVGSDEAPGNLPAARQSIATALSPNPQNSSTTSTASTNPITQAFNQLSVDLQSGNLSAAQQDYSTIRRDFQTQDQTAQTQGHVHHHHHGGGGNSSEVSQLFDQLGQELQSGSLSTAQQTYSSLLTDLPSGLTTGQTQSPSTGVSLNA
jgi:outer membrane protein assembly factor BamD (BamD/ComL family)